MTQPWSTLIAVAVGLGIVWVALLIALAAARPKDISVTDALRLLPDTAVLLRAWPPIRNCREVSGSVCSWCCST